VILSGLTHNAFIGNASISRQMKQDRHVILVIRSVESCNIDEGASQAIPEILSVESGFPMIIKGQRVTISIRVLDIVRIGIASERCKRQ